MKNYEMKRKKMEQEQLINSILNNKQMEHEALIKAAKEVKDNSKEKIEERKNEILNENRKKQEEENKKQLEELEIQDQLDKWNEKIQQAKMLREVRVNEIMKELEEERRQKEEKNNNNAFKTIVSRKREELEIKERENFRRKQKIEQEKRKKLAKQWQEIQKKKVDDEKRKKGQEIIDKARGTSFKKQLKSFVEKINPFKKNKAIEAYTKSMDMYNMQFGNTPYIKNTNNSSKAGKQEKASPAQSLFGEYYKRAYIDHNKAKENVNKNELEKSTVTFRGRIIG